jgi:hypothetical protein
MQFMALCLNNKDKTIKGLESNFKICFFMAQNDAMPIFMDRFVW